MVNDLYSALPNDCAYIFLLFINVPDLEPDVGMGEGTWWVAEDAVEAAEGLFVLALLFVDDAETEEDFVGVVEILWN